jgi:hypothetical protein
MLVDWLVRRGACRRVSPPAWWSAPAPEQLAAYAGVLDHLQLQILADRKNRALDALDAGMHAEFVENALAAADAHAGACALFRLAAATTALYARRADALPSALRRRVIDLLRAQTDPSSPLYQLSPHLLRRLDEPLEAGARAQTLESTASPAYRAWLSRVAGPVD